MTIIIAVAPASHDTICPQTNVLYIAPVHLLYLSFLMFMYMYQLQSLRLVLLHMALLISKILLMILGRCLIQLHR